MVNERHQEKGVNGNIKMRLTAGCNAWLIYCRNGKIVLQKSGKMNLQRRKYT